MNEGAQILITLAIGGIVMLAAAFAICGLSDYLRRPKGKRNVMPLTAVRLASKRKNHIQALISFPLATVLYVFGIIGLLEDGAFTVGLAFVFTGLWVLYAQIDLAWTIYRSPQALLATFGTLITILLPISAFFVLRDSKRMLTTLRLRENAEPRSSPAERDASCPATTAISEVQVEGGFAEAQTCHTEGMVPCGTCNRTVLMMSDGRCPGCGRMLRS